MSANNGYTPTQKRLLEVLSDGKPHAKKVLMGCLYDDLTEVNTLEVAINALRKKLLPKGRDVVARNGCYIIMRTLASANDGKR